MKSRLRYIPGSPGREPSEEHLAFSGWGGGFPATVAGLRLLDSAHRITTLLGSLIRNLLIRNVEARLGFLSMEIQIRDYYSGRRHVRERCYGTIYPIRDYYSGRRHVRERMTVGDYCGPYGTFSGGSGGSGRLRSREPPRTPRSKRRFLFCFVCDKLTSVIVCPREWFWVRTKPNY